jgi:hypothetical protein
MGFCSGTDIFDPVIDCILKQSPDRLHPEARRELIRALILALWKHDWDCETDSEYFENPIVHEVFKALKPEWFDDEAGA